MEKPASVDHPVHDLIRRRWSPRVFSAQPVTTRELLSLFEAARWAPSCYNEQPWSFIVATRDQPDAYERLLTCLVPANQTWAWRAPALALSVARLAFERNGKPNRHACHDVGQAVALLCIQATAMGMFVHQMAGFDAAKARETFAIPESHEPVAAIALGHPADPAHLNEEQRTNEERPRERKKLHSFVFAKRWGDAADTLG
ncbi:MAG: nitroreductase family protein [Alphaproteobacteria bacterium]